MDFRHYKKRKKFCSELSARAEALITVYNMCVSGYMLLTIRVGRSDYFFYFLQ